MHLSMTVTVPAPADEPYFIVDECDVFSNENPAENDSASLLRDFCSSYILVNSPYPLEMDTYRAPHHMKTKSAGKPVYALPSQMIQLVCPDKQVRKFVKAYCRGDFTARNSSTATFVRLIVLKTLQLYVPK
ncbi:hypothetical protein EMCRGX_G027339 [Ephydatia muelleri]